MWFAPSFQFWGTWFKWVDETLLVERTLKSYINGRPGVEKSYIIWHLPLRFCLSQRPFLWTVISWQSNGDLILSLMRRKRYFCHLILSLPLFLISFFTSHTTLPASKSTLLRFLAHLLLLQIHVALKREVNFEFIHGGLLLNCSIPIVVSQKS